MKRRAAVLLAMSGLAVLLSVSRPALAGSASCGGVSPVTNACSAMTSVGDLAPVVSINNSTLLDTTMTATASSPTGTQTLSCTKTLEPSYYGVGYETSCTLTQTGSFTLGQTLTLTGSVAGEPTPLGNWSVRVDSGSSGY